MAGRVATLLSVLWLTGCGLGPFSEPEPGSESAPSSGAGPFRKPPLDFDTLAEEPYVVTDRVASVSEPTALWRDDGGFRLWFQRQDDTGPAEIWSAELPSVHELPDRGPERVLAPELPWHQDFVGEPSIARAKSGELIMAYRGGRTEPAIGLARSDDGRTFRFDEEPLLRGARSPGIAIAGDAAYLVYERDDRDGIFLAELDGDSLRELDGPVIAARPDLDGAFDRLSVAAPSLSLGETLSGQLRLGIHFEGQRPISNETRRSVGYAAAFEGGSFERFLQEKPVVDEGLPGEGAPAVLVGSVRALLFFEEEERNRTRIAVGLFP